MLVSNIVIAWTEAANFIYFKMTNSIYFRDWLQPAKVCSSRCRIYICS